MAMSGTGPARTSAIGLAALTWFAILLQLVLSLRLALANGRTVAMGVVVFFGFFTILTNLLVAVAVTVPLVAPRAAAGRFFASASVLGSVATSIALVGLGYHWLLREVWTPQGLQLLADLLLHYVVPAGFVAWWIGFAPKSGLTAMAPLRWAAWPLGYFAYALVRGALTGLYAYPFIDVPAIGYARALINSLGLLVAFLLLGMLFLAVARILPSRARVS
jgi:hypothetical protein